MNCYVYVLYSEICLSILTGLVNNNILSVFYGKIRDTHNFSLKTGYSL